MTSSPPSRVTHMLPSSSSSSSSSSSGRCRGGMFQYRLSHNWAALFVAVVGGWVYGYNTGIIGGLSKPIVNNTFFHGRSSQDRSTLQGVLTAEILVGGFMGSFVGVSVANRWGRKRSMMMMSLLCLLSGVVMACANSFALLVLARTVMGLAVGFSGCICPMYVSEMADHHISGRLGTVFQIAICASILLAQVVNYAVYPYDVDDDTVLSDWQWQVQFGLGTIPGALMLLLLRFLPESAVFTSQLQQQHQQPYEKSNLRPVDDLQDHSSNGYSPANVQHHPAQQQQQHQQQQQLLDADNDKVLVFGTPSSNNNEYVALSATVADGDDGGNRKLTHRNSDGTAPSSSSSSSVAAGWAFLFSRAGAKSLFIALVLAMASQLTGINAIIFYAPTIFKDAGLSNVLLLTIAVVGVWNLLSVFISFALVDKLGRRPLMLGALVLMTLGSGILSLAYEAFPLHKSAVAIVSVVLFIGAFECGPGPLFFVMASESFPDDCREQGLSVANALAWTFNIMISFGFPVINDSAGSAAIFFIFTVAGALSIVLIFFFLPETKGRIIAHHPLTEQDDEDSQLQP